MVGLAGKKGGGDAQVVITAKLELNSLSILIKLVITEMTNAAWPHGVTCTHLGVKVSEQDQVFFWRDSILASS